MGGDRRYLHAILVGLLLVAGCKDKSTSSEKRSPSVSLTDNAGSVLGELATLESKKDVTCWTSFRQLDWFVAEKSYSEFGTLAKIAAVKGLVRAVWARAAAASKGPTVSAADIAKAVSLPKVDLSPKVKSDLPEFANDLGIENFTNYQKTAEHWRVLLGVIQDEIYYQGQLEPLEAEAVEALADTATTLSLILLKRSGQAAEARKATLIDGEDVQAVYQELLAEHDLANPPRKGKPLDADEVAKTLQPLTKRLIESKIRALSAFNKTTGNLTSDLNKVTRVPLTPEAVDYFLKQVQSFNHFVASGIDPMRADNYLSDGSFANTKFVRKPYLDEVTVQNAVMQLFPHHIEANGDVRLRFEPNPGPVVPVAREPFEILLLDHEQNGVRDSGIHWIAMRNVHGERPFAMDPFAAEYLSEVNSMMLTLFIRRADDIAREMGVGKIDMAVARRVQDTSMVMVPPHQAASTAWTAEREAQKAQLMAAYSPPLFRDVSKKSGLATRLPRFEGKGVEAVDAHVEPPKTDKLEGHVEPPKTDKLEGHVEPPKTDKLEAHVEPGTVSLAGRFNLQRIMGGGIAVGDVNRDGYPDLFLAGEGLGKLYVNRGKKAPGQFDDATGAWKIPSPIDDGHGTLLVDLEGDGDDDLIILRSDHPSMILRNEGKSFVDVTEKLGFAPHRGAHVVTAFDYDKDSDLDLYIGYYGNHSSNTGGEVRSLPSLDGRNGSPNQMWRQEPDGSFREVGADIGVADTGWALALGTFDYGADGDLDLVVANDFGANRLFENRGDGSFRDITDATQTGDRGSGMNVDFGDVDGDGRLDIYITNIDMFSKRIKVVFPRDESTIEIDAPLVRAMQYLSGNKLYGQTDDEKQPFVDRESEWMEPGDRGWGWDAGFFDYDNDGDDDLYLCNGWVDGSYAGGQNNQFFVNHEGFLYLAPEQSPEAFAGNSRSAAYVDIDRDGDVDMVVNNFRQPPRVLVNPRKGNWARLRLRQGGKNPTAIGAQMTIRAGDTTIVRQVVTGRGYLGQADPAVHVGLGAATSFEVSIRWPDGTTSEHKGLAGNREHVLTAR